MAVVIETTLGDITVDLFIEQRPTTCLNFLKLCKMKFYNYNLFHTIRRGFIAQTGDPTGEGSGGESIFGLLEGPKKRFFSGEKMPRIRHTDAGLLSMVCTEEAMVGSQFFFTLGTDLDSLDGVHCVIGEVTEGHDVLRKLNDVICDETHRPYQDVRITHTVVLADPFNDPAGLRAPSRSPSPSAERLKGGRIAPDEDIDETHGKSAAELQEYIEEKEAKARATILEIVGDLPDADIAPPENVLFVCKLNPVTSDEDLEIIFSRFGKIVTCEVIRDKKSGDSLQYAFIEFSDKKSCEDAYFKMDNVLIDDRRIHVDFSQSVSKIKWLGKGRGVKHITDDDAGSKNINKDPRQKARRSPSRDRYKPTKQVQRNNRDYQKDRDNRQQRDEREHRQSRRENNRDARKLSRSRSPIRQRKDRSDRDRNSTRTSDSKSSRQSEGEKRSSKHVGRENNDNNSHKSSLRHKDTHHNGTANLDSNRSKATNSSRYKNNTDDVQNPTEEKRDKERHKKHRENRDNKNGLEKDERETTTKSTNKENDKISKDNDLKRDKKKSSKRDNEHRNNDRSKERKLDKKVENQDAVPKTPSPDVIKRSTKTKNKEKAAKRSEKSKNLKKSKLVKKKRKPSTSSSSDSSSSSSSETSSSSESDNKKKKNKRKKRYSSTESSTSDSSTSSSSSSSTDSSSDSSSSSSDSDKKKRKIKKTLSKKTVKKSRKK